MIKKNYKAHSLSEAINLIKQEMGPKASIVSTVTIPAKRTLFRFTPSLVEVVATVDEKHLTHEQLTHLSGEVTENLPKTEKRGGFLSVIFPATKPEGMFQPGLKQGRASMEPREEMAEVSDTRELRATLRRLETENRELKRQLAILADSQDEFNLELKGIKRFSK